MSHITQRHIARSITGDSKRSLVGLAAMVLGLLAASRSHSPDAMSAVVAGSQAATVQGQLNFSRDVEREADRVGFQVMTAAGFDRGGMASMFEKMDLSARLNDFGGFPYLRTHPLTVERIGEARARAGIVPSASGPVAGATPDERPRAHRRAGACARPDGSARRCLAALAGARRRPRRQRRRQAARRVRKRARVEPAARLVARRRELRERARDRARQPEQQRARRARGRPHQGAVAARSRPAAAGRRGDEGVCERRLAAEPAARRADRAARDARGHARQRTAQGERVGAPDLGRGPSRRRARLGRARTDLGQARCSAARAPCRGRVALRARRSRRRRRAAARRTAPRARRRPGRFHRRVGARLAPARDRGRAQAARRRISAPARRQRLLRRARTAAPSPRRSPARTGCRAASRSAPRRSRRREIPRAATPRNRTSRR